MKKQVTVTMRSPENNGDINKAKCKSKDPNMINVFLVSIGFGLCFFGTNTFMNFAVPILGDLGSICMAVVNLVNAFSNFLVPSVIGFFGTPERSLFWCGMSYIFYISQFSYVIPFVSVTVCAIHGFLSSVAWASQGIILGNNSCNKDRGKKSGIFLAIYMLGSALGNMISGVLVKKLNIGDVVIHNGWNGSASILFLFLGCSTILALIPYGLLRPAKPYDDDSLIEVKTLTASPKSDTEPQQMNTDEDKKAVMADGEKAVVVVEEKAPVAKQSIWKDIVGVVRAAVGPDMILLLLFFFNDGWEQVFMMSQFNRQIVDMSSVGTIMAIYSVVDVVFSYIHGCLSDRFGHGLVITLATVFEMIGLLIAWYANKQQNWLNYATGVILAISDAAFQTECLAIVNQYFPTDRTNANSVFRMCFGFGFALLVTPFFISKGEKYSSPTQFLWEIIVAAVIAIGGYIFTVWFLAKQKKAKKLAMQRAKEIIQYFV